MSSVLATHLQYPFSTVHLAWLPSFFTTHCDRTFPTKRTVASEGGLPSASCVLAVPGVTTAGTGRLRSWISHLGSTWALQIVAPERANSAATRIEYLFMFGASRNH